MFPNPENFDWIEIRPARKLPFGEEGPYRVVGINRSYSRDEQDKERSIQEDIKTRQLAEVWMGLYLEMYVKENMFPRYMEGRLFEPLDTEN